MDTAPLPASAADPRLDHGATAAQGCGGQDRCFDTGRRWLAAPGDSDSAGSGRHRMDPGRLDIPDPVPMPSPASPATGRRGGGPGRSCLGLRWLRGMVAASPLLVCGVGALAWTAGPARAGTPGVAPKPAATNPNQPYAINRSGLLPPPCPLIVPPQLPALQPIRIAPSQVAAKNRMGCLSAADALYGPDGCPVKLCPPQSGSLPLPGQAR